MTIPQTNPVERTPGPTPEELENILDAAFVLLERACENKNQEEFLSQTWPFVVRACNAHDQLVEACKATKEALSNLKPIDHFSGLGRTESLKIYQAYHKILAALTLATTVPEGGA